MLSSWAHIDWRIHHARPRALGKLVCLAAGGSRSRDRDTYPRLVSPASSRAIAQTIVEEAHRPGLSAIPSATVTTPRRFHIGQPQVTPTGSDHPSQYGATTICPARPRWNSGIHHSRPGSRSPIMTGYVVVSDGIRICIVCDTRLYPRCRAR